MTLHPDIKPDAKPARTAVALIATLKAAADGDLTQIIPAPRKDAKP